MGKGNTFVLNMRKQSHMQSLNVESFLLQDHLNYSHIHYKLCNISLTTTLYFPPIPYLNPIA